jgi:hypothetical protein
LNAREAPQVKLRLPNFNNLNLLLFNQTEPAEATEKTAFLKYITNINNWLRKFGQNITKITFQKERKSERTMKVCE